MKNKKDKNFMASKPMLFADWRNIKTHKPALGSKVLIFCLFTNKFGNTYEDYYVAIYGVNFWDKRKKCFYDQIAYSNENGRKGEKNQNFTCRDAWVYKDVQYWHELVSPICK